MTAGRSTGHQLRGKIALVTGAARGIGRASAIAMARQGASIVTADVAGPVSDTLEVTPASVDDLVETGRLVAEAGSHSYQLRFDQRSMGEVRQAAADIEAAFGGVDIIHANAGIQAFKPFLEMEDADWHDQIDVNLNGTANVLRAFVPLLIRRGGGRIIVTSSTQGRHGTKHGSAYSASKWALIGLVKSLALELGQHGITVNALIPGLIDTPLTRHEQRYAQAIEASGQCPTGDVSKDEEMARVTLLTRTPLGVPWVSPEDVAPVVVFLASNEARMVTGASYEVTGGDSANLP